MHRGMVPYEEGEQVSVKLVSEAGTLLVQSHVAGVRNELRWFPNGGGDHVLVHDFGANKEWQVGGADFDGRYLVYSVYHSMRIFTSSWSVYAWDADLGGEPQLVAESPTGPDSEPISGPLNYPVVHEGVAYWVEATLGAADTFMTELHRYDLSDRSQEVIQSGYLQYPFRMGSLLLWSEAEGPGSETQFRALSLISGESEPPPGPLADLQGTAFIGANDDTVAWTNQGMDELWVWRTSWDEPVRVFGNSTEASVEWIHVAGDVVAWNHRELGQWALDLRSGGYAQLTPEWGSTDSGGTYLRIGFMPDLSQDKENAVSEQTVIDTAALPPLPGCS